MDRFLKYRLDHVIFWLATVGFHTFTRLHLIGKVGMGQFLLEILIRNGLLAALIYLNLFLLIPRFIRKKRFFAYALLLLLAFAGYVVLKNAHDVYLYGYVVGDESRRGFFNNSFYNLSIAVFYLSFSVALQLSREWYAQRELIRKIEVEKLNTELEYLKAQINPHFLFNSINTIYFQIDRHNTNARETLSAFSEMLRYQLYDCNGREVPVEKEVAYLKNYVDLQRLRKDEHYEISFVSRNMNGFTIAPLLLIPFVENAFKHVSHSSNSNKVQIDMDCMDGFFRMNVFNTTDSDVSDANTRGGIGLRNVRRRLQLLYGDRHALTIRETPGTFEINLEIKLNQNGNELPDR